MLTIYKLSLCGPKWAETELSFGAAAGVVCTLLEGKITAGLQVSFNSKKDWYLDEKVPKLIGESGEVYFQYLARCLKASRSTGARVNDARIAAICLSHGVDELLSADRDFSRFPGLKIRNPLVG